MQQTVTFFVHMNASRAWLTLSHAERSDFAAKALAPLLEKYPNITLRFYDTEAFTTKCSDIAVFETNSIPDFYGLMDSIRDSQLFTVPYFEFVDIIPAIEADFV
ncbi:MAG: Darcynin 1 [Anaerolineae bacterium]|nr:Darcynin 1 [Anaerolineae bacterium]